jgi:hypothetical protein
MHKPPKDIVERYRNLEKARKDKLLAGFLEDIKRGEVKKEREEVNLDAVVKNVISNHTIYESKRSKPHNLELDVNKIEFRLKVPNRMAKYIKGEAEKALNEKANALRREMQNDGNNNRNSTNHNDTKPNI